MIEKTFEERKDDLAECCWDSGLLHHNLDDLVKSVLIQLEFMGNYKPELVLEIMDATEKSINEETVLTWKKNKEESKNTIKKMIEGTFECK